MDNKVKFCVVCGRKIPELSMRKRTCSVFCAKRKKAGYAPYINCDKPPFSDLAEMQRKAAEKGMSYGQYVAMKQKEEGNK